MTAIGNRNCIQVLDLNGRVLSTNPDGQKLLGPGASNALPSFWTEWWTDELRDLARIALSSAQNGEGGHFETFASFGGSDPKWWDVTVTRLPGEDGNAERLLAVTRDVYERKINEEHLRESEERFRAAFSQSVMGMVLTDLNGVVQRANDAFCRIVGYSEQELLGRTSFHFTHPEDRENNTEAVRRLRENREGSCTYEKRYIRKDGEVVWTQINLSLVHDAAGRPSSLIATVEDITGQKRSQEALQEREQHLRLIFESVTDYAIFTVDRTGAVTSWNPGAETIFGYKASEIIGHKSATLRVPEDREKELPKMLEEVGEGEVERWFVRKNGERFPAVGSIRPMRDVAGNLIGFTKVYRDVAAERLAEKELADARAQIAAAAKAEHARLADVFKRSPSFIAVLRGPDHVFELANERYYQLIGQRDILHKPVREALPEVDGQGFVALLDHVYTTGEPYVGNNVGLMLQRHPGQPMEERYVDFVYQATREPNGAISGVFAHGVDVTERKLAEDTLHRLAEQRRLALDSAKLGWWHYDLREGKVYWDERFKVIFGVGTENLEYENVIALMHPDDRARVDAAVKQATNPDHPQPYSIEYRVVHGDGSLHWVLSKGQAYFEGKGDERRAVSFVGTVADITEAKAAESALRESEARFRQLADAMPQIVWQASPDGHVDYYNHRWYEYTGMPLGVTGDQSWEPVLHPDDLQRTHETWARSLRTSEPYEIAYRFRRADGAYRWHLGRALPVKDEHGNVLRWFGTNTDIHDYKQLQEQNEQLLASERAARTDAERASRMKDEFLATLSHELRTPLNAVLGWTQILRSGPLEPGELEDGLNTIERNARAQKQIIEDLLDMSRIISGKVRLDVQRVDLAPVVEAALDTIRPAAEAKGIRLHAVLDPLARPVSGDPNRLQQVFWNLLSNAVKFTPKEGRIQVILERVNSHLEVSVIDTGEGIRPEFLPHVFDRFRQADASTTRRHGGLGLGLAIVKQLVELHGGTVRVKSGGVGFGTTFTVALPLTVIHPGPEDEPERRHPEAESLESLDLDSCLKLDGVRILVVDDEPDARALVKRLLEHCNAVVRTAGSAKEALELLRSEKPDVLISDIGMPQEDGYSLIRRIRALTPEQGGNVPALALTAYARAEDRMKAIRAGFQMHVPKPVEGAELLTMVASLAGVQGGE